MGRFLAAITTAVILTLYLLLARRNPSFTLLTPRGGIVGLGISLLIANAALWFAQQPDRAVSARFQIAAAGWIWLLVQLGALVYLLAQSS